MYTQIYQPMTIFHPTFRADLDVKNMNPLSQNANGRYLIFELVARGDVQNLRYLIQQEKIKPSIFNLRDASGHDIFSYVNNESIRNLLQIYRDTNKPTNNNKNDNVAATNNYNPFPEITSPRKLNIIVRTAHNIENTADPEKETAIQANAETSTGQTQNTSYFDVFEEKEADTDTEQKTAVQENVKPHTEIKYPDNYSNYRKFPVYPNMNMDKLIGLDFVKEELRKIIVTIENSKDKKQKSTPLKIPNGILLVSEQQYGTDSVISAFVNETGLPALQIFNFGDLDPIIKDAEKNYKDNGLRTIVVASDFDGFYNNNDYQREAEKNKFANLLKNCSDKGILFIATTNDAEKINESFKRAGLLESILTLQPATDDERKSYIQQQIKKEQQLSSLTDHLDEITESTVGFHFAEIKVILDETIRALMSTDQDKDAMTVFNERLAKYTKTRGLIPIDSYNKTAAYDTPEFKRTPITDKDPTIDNLGGMYEIRKKLNDLYILPMQNLETLQAELGDDAIPDGAIFYGEPGNGKTYIAKALAKSLGLPFYETKLSDIGTALVHEEGKAFKKLADQLNRKFKETGERSVWFLDEFDSLGSNRGEAAQHNKELTDALLQELNNPAERGFILIAATNNLDDIDPALKRRGRLGNWIHFDNPTFEERADVIKKVLLRAPSTKHLGEDDAIVEKISKDFDGMSMSSITSVLKDAIRQTIIQKIDFNSAIELCKDENNKRMMGDFCKKTGLKQHEYTEWDFKSLDELSGMEDVKQQLKESVIDVWDPEIRKALLANKRRLPGGVILYGPPATGKTTIVETLARQMDVPLYKMDYSSINDGQYIHQIAKHVVEIFNRLELESKIIKKPVMLFFDEAERFFPNHAERHQIEEVNTYKDKMNDAAANGIILIGATNCIAKVNPEIVENPRRMGTKIKVDNPNEKNRYDLIHKSLASLPIMAGVITIANCEELAKITDGWSIGQISDTIDRIISKAIKKKENIKYETILHAFKNKII